MSFNAKLLTAVAGTTAAAALVIAPAGARAQPTTQTFQFTGAPETFTVPADVCGLTVDAYGAAGGDAIYGAPGGLGGSVSATVDVTPGQVLTIDVGEAGTGGNLNTGTPARGGYGGGGQPGGYMDTLLPGNGTNGGGGGGATTVGFAGADPFLIAGGGGGGAGSFETGTAGQGGAGGEAGTNGSSPPGDPGSGQGGKSGGNGGAGGAGGVGDPNMPQGLPGGSATGRVGGDGATGLGDPHLGSGGGGGGGAHGGGAGGSAGYSVYWGGGGGGGSSLGPAGAVYGTGVREGNGEVTLAYEPGSCPPPPTPTPCWDKLKVNKTVDKAKVPVRGRVRYRIHLVNTCTVAIDEATFTDDLSDVRDHGSLKGSISKTSGTIARSRRGFTWTGRLAPGQTATITFTVVAGKPGKMTNTVSWRCRPQESCTDKTRTKVYRRPADCRLTVAGQSVAGRPNAGKSEGCSKPVNRPYRLPAVW